MTQGAEAAIRLCEGTILARDNKSQIFDAILGISMAPVFNRFAKTSLPAWIMVRECMLVAGTLASIYYLYALRDRKSTRRTYDGRLVDTRVPALLDRADYG